MTLKKTTKPSAIFCSNFRRFSKTKFDNFCKNNSPNFKLQSKKFLQSVSLMYLKKKSNIIPTKPSASTKSVKIGQKNPKFNNFSKTNY